MSRLIPHNSAFIHDLRSMRAREKETDPCLVDEMYAQYWYAHRSLILPPSDFN